MFSKGYKMTLTLDLKRQIEGTHSLCYINQNQPVSFAAIAQLKVGPIKADISSDHCAQYRESSARSKERGVLRSLESWLCKLHYQAYHKIVSWWASRVFSCIYQERTSPTCFIWPRAYRIVFDPQPIEQALKFATTGLRSQAILDAVYGKIEQERILWRGEHLPEPLPFVLSFGWGSAKEKWERKAYYGKYKIERV